MASPNFHYSLPSGSTLYIDGKPIGKTIEKIVYCNTPAPDLSFIGSGGISSKESIRIFQEQFNKVKQITMNKQITEQIKKIKGVKTVEPHPESDRVVVTFEAEKPRAVKCTNSEQWDFIKNKNGLKFPFTPGHVLLCENGMRSMNYARCTIIPFTQYLSEYNLTGEWEKYLIGEAEKRYPVGTKYKSASQDGTCRVEGSFHYSSSCFPKITDGYGGSVYYNGNWAEIIPNEVELVRGEIYAWSDRIIRFESTNHSGSINLYSQLLKNQNKNKDFYFDSKDVSYSSAVLYLKPATKKQKKKLIRAEVKNGYFHELRSKDS